MKIKIFCENEQEVERKKLYAVRNGWYISNIIHSLKRNTVETHLTRMRDKVIYWRKVS